MGPEKPKGGVEMPKPKTKLVNMDGQWGDVQGDELSQESPTTDDTQPLRIISGVKRFPDGERFVPGTSEETGVLPKLDR